MNNQKPFTTRLLDLALENKIWALSVAVPLLGAIPLYIYAMSAGELPDFSLGELTGTLIASFLTELFLGMAMVGYLLFTGFATRKAVAAFYPGANGTAADDHGYLIRGNFILGVTIFSLLAWFGLLTKSFDAWLSPQNPELSRGAYVLSLGSAALLLLVDWRRGRRPLKYALLALLAASITFLAVLVTAYLNGYVVVPQGNPVPPPSSSVSLVAIGTWSANACAWLLQDRLIGTAFVAAISVAVAIPVAARITRGRRDANRSGRPPQPFFGSEATRLMAAKVWATLVFCFCASVTFLFLSVVVSASPLHTQTVIAIVGGSYLILLNCGAFAARDWRQRAWIGVATFGLVFIILPLQGDNATLLPKMVVNVLGFGNRHATNVALDGTECSALAPYGVDCSATKDTSIGITNVNILDRLGSTVLIELQLRQSTDSEITSEIERPAMPAAVVRGSSSRRVTLRTLTMPIGLAKEGQNSLVASWYPCDSLLLEKLRAVDSAKANALACVKLSVPKERMIGHTINGPATYVGDFSQYVRLSP